MTKKSFVTRFKVTATGKLLRRAMGLGHSRAKKSGVQMRRKENQRTLGGIAMKKLSPYL